VILKNIDKSVKAICLIICIVSIFFNASIAIAGIQISSHDLSAEGYYTGAVAVHYVLTDPEGRKLGYDPYTDKSYNDFPPGTAGYGDEGIDDISIVLEILEPLDGKYLIAAIGDLLTGVTFYIAVLREDIKNEGFIKFHFEGLVDKGLPSKFEITYTSDPTIPAATITRIATPSGLKQDITLSGKIGWIDNQGILNSLLKKAEAIETSISKGNKEAAENQINALISEIEAQRGKHISDKAAKILLEDTEYLMKSL